MDVYFLGLRISINLIQSILSGSREHSFYREDACNLVCQVQSTILINTLKLKSMFVWGRMRGSPPLIVSIRGYEGQLAPAGSGSG